MNNELIRIDGILKMKFKKSIHTWVALLMITLMGAGCVSVERSLVSGRKRAYGYTWQQEVQLGKEADQSIIVQYGLYDDKELEAYITRIGEELLAKSHLRREDTPAEMKNTPFTFRLLDSPVVNAFALPGGYVYITRGLLAHLENEAQLAVVIGHEIGHVVGRHGSKRAATQQFGQLAVIAGAVGAQGILGGNAGQEFLNTAGTAASLLFLSYGRDDERESDRLGVEYGALEGYQSAEGSEFFRSLKRMSDNAGQSIPSFLSTHPDPGEREEKIKQMAADWSQKVQMDKIEAEAYLAKIDDIIVGDDPRQGYTENGIFYHPTLKFQFPVPSGYQVINQPTQVAMIESEQKAIQVFTIASDVSTAQAAGAKFAGQEGITVIDQGATRVNGLTAYDVIATATDQQGAEYQLISRYIEYSGNVYSFLAYTNSTAYNTYRTGFYQTIDGFRQLTDQSKINVSPTRLDVITAPRTGTFQSLLPANLPRGFTAEDIAIINQINLDDNIARGTKIKIPK